MARLLAARTSNIGRTAGVWTIACRLPRGAIAATVARSTNARREGLGRGRPFSDRDADPFRCEAPVGALQRRVVAQVRPDASADGAEQELHSVQGGRFGDRGRGVDHGQERDLVPLVEEAGHLVGDDAAERPAAQVVRPAGLDDAAYARKLAVLAPLYHHRFDAERAERERRTRVVSAAANRRGSELVRGYDLLPRLGALRVPTLILVGRDDIVNPSSVADRLHRAIAGSEIVTFAASGHFPFEEESDAFSATVRGWLGRR